MSESQRGGGGRGFAFESTTAGIRTTVRVALAVEISCKLSATRIRIRVNVAFMFVSVYVCGVLSDTNNRLLFLSASPPDVRRRLCLAVGCQPYGLGSALGSRFALKRRRCLHFEN